MSEGWSAAKCTATKVPGAPYIYRVVVTREHPVHDSVYASMDVTYAEYGEYAVRDAIKRCADRVDLEIASLFPTAPAQEAVHRASELDVSRRPKGGGG